MTFETPLRPDPPSRVSLSRGTALVGAPTAEIGDICPGKAYAYELSFGEPTCSGVANSTGQPGTLYATGSPSARAGALRLTAGDLPAEVPVLFLAGRSGKVVPNPRGSLGNLCVGPELAIFRDAVMSSGPAGEAALVVDVAHIPLASPTIIQAGETWHFQAWYREDFLGADSNFTQGVSVTFE